MSSKATTYITPRPAPARLQDVAERAGVAKSIASRILNGTGVAVRQETRERVEAAARELDYRPNPVARALNRSATGSVAVVVPDLANVVYTRIVRGAVRIATAAGVAVLVIEDAAGGRDLAALLDSGRIDGVMMLAARPDHELLPLLLDGETPCVFAHRAVPGSGRNVTIDDAYASELAVAHLAQLGHRRIAHIAGPAGIDTAERRAAGFREATAALGLEHAPVVHTDYDERRGADAAGDLLTRGPGVTAIFTASLPQAIGVRAAAAERALDVPRDLSIVSYDDMPLADYLQPALTTVRVPLEELGATALEALLDQLRGDAPRERTIATAPQIIVRQSTAEAP